MSSAQLRNPARDDVTKSHSLFSVQVKYTATSYLQLRTTSIPHPGAIQDLLPGAKEDRNFTLWGTSQGYSVTTGHKLCIQRSSCVDFLPWMRESVTCKSCEGLEKLSVKTEEIVERILWRKREWRTRWWWWWGKTRYAEITNYDNGSSPHTALHNMTIAVFCDKYVSASTSNVV